MTQTATTLGSTAPPIGPAFRRSIVPLLLLAVAMVAGFTAMGSFGTVQEGAKAELHLSDNALGLIQGLGNAVPLVLFSIPIGILVDRINRVRLLLALAVIWTLGTLLTAFAPGVPTLVAARMLTGIGTTGALTATLSLCADLCSVPQRGRALLIVNLGKSLGIAAAFGLTGWLFGHFIHAPQWSGFLAVTPWRRAHIAIAVLSALALLPLLLLREPPRREVEAGPGAPFATVAHELWQRRAFLIPLFAGQVAVVMADAAAGVWVAPVLSRNFGQQPQDFGSWVGALVFAAGLAGTVLGGISAELGQKLRRRGGLLLGALIAAGIGIPAALFPIMPGVTSLAVALGVLVTCGSVTALVISVALTVYIPNELRGLCIGAFISIAGLVGYGLAPPLVSGVSTLMGGEQHLAGALALVGCVVSGASFVAFAAAMKHIPMAIVAEPIG